MEEMMQLLPVTLAVAVLATAVVAYLGRRSTQSAGNYTRRAVPAVPATTIEVRDPEAARRMIIDDPAAFSDHPASPFPVDLDAVAGGPKTTSINSAPHGPLWRALRRNLTAGVLHRSRLDARLAPLQRDAVDALLADLALQRLAARRGDGGAAVVVDVRDALYAAVFKVVARLCFGDGDGDGADVGAMQRALREFFQSGVDAGRLASSRLARLLHWRRWRYLVGTRRRLAELFGPAIAARRRRRLSDDGGDGAGGGIQSYSYVDSLLDLRVPDDGDGDGNDGGQRRALRDDEIVRLVWEFLGASTETVVACVEWTLARLVAHPEVQEKLHRELTGGGGGDQSAVPLPCEELERHHDSPYLRAVVLESLRLHPPAPLILRDVVGGELPDGGATAAVRYVFMAEDIGRDPRAWTDPEEFRPERFLAGGEAEDVTSPVPGPKEIRMMPFGAGRRHCPGAGLAMAQASCFVAALVREFEWSPPADDGAGGGVDCTSAANALFLKVMASPLRASIVPRRS